ncbi:hypothetical protein ACOSQ3_009540 [Xanthoceras sorbifolium]
MYKINCDTAICANGNCVRIEVIIRDSSRDVMLSALKTIVAGLSPSIVEASAIHAGIKLAVETGLLPAIVESDSLSVVNLLLARQPICSEICLVINDILELKTLYGFSSFVFSLITSNRVAHSLVKMVIVYAIDVVLIEEVLPGIRLFVQKEPIFS